MLIFAVSLYLPHHMAEVVKKAWFYYTGDETMMTTRMTGGQAHPLDVKEL